MQESVRRGGRGLTGLLLVMVCVAAGVWAAQDGGEPAHPREIVLSQRAPTAVFSIDWERVRKGETTVVVHLVRADNPDHVQFTANLTLSECRGGSKKHAFPVGSLGVYPVAANEGSYAFDLAPALKEMRGANVQPDQVCMKLELHPLRALADWKRLRVTVTSPEWKEPAPH